MGIKDLDLSGAVERMKIILPNLKNDQAQFDLKTIIDGLEAAESQVAALTASLASVTKERDREIDALQEEAEAHKFTTEMYATQCKQSWKESLRAESVEASLASEKSKVEELRANLNSPEMYWRGEWAKEAAKLAELRKRMEIARLALEQAEHGLIVTHNLDA